MASTGRSSSTRQGPYENQLFLTTPVSTGDYNTPADTISVSVGSLVLTPDQYVVDPGSRRGHRARRRPAGRLDRDRDRRPADRAAAHARRERRRPSGRAPAGPQLERLHHGHRQRRRRHRAHRLRNRHDHVHRPDSGRRADPRRRSSSSRRSSSRCRRSPAPTTTRSTRPARHCRSRSSAARATTRSRPASAAT